MEKITRNEFLIKAWIPNYIVDLLKIPENGLFIKHGSKIGFILTKEELEKKDEDIFWDIEKYAIKRLENLDYLEYAFGLRDLTHFQFFRVLFIDKKRCIRAEWTIDRTRSEEGWDDFIKEIEKCISLPRIIL